jgi:hypothetical protein
LSGIMANDWFMFPELAGSFTGTSCIFFVQVAFVGRSGTGPVARDSLPGRRAIARFIPG